jgi:hypothetical protein
MVWAVGVFTEPGMLTGMRRGEVVRPEEPELAKGKLGLEDKVFLMFVGGQSPEGSFGLDVSKVGIEK